MASQRCPKCGSSRTRRGYRPTYWWQKIFFRYCLLCDRCNWEFVGFAIPGTVGTKATRKGEGRAASSKVTETKGADDHSENSVYEDFSSELQTDFAVTDSEKPRIKKTESAKGEKRIRIRS